MKPRTLILRTAGTNCDAETAYAFELAGADCEKIHVNRVLREPSLLDQFQMMAFPGGFSYGDDIAAGRILANQIAHHLAENLRRFIDSGKPVIGICNGFQVLVKTELLPGPLGSGELSRTSSGERGRTGSGEPSRTGSGERGRTGQTCTLAHNDTGRYTDRWVHLAPRGAKCIWTRGMENLELPIAHGEGKFVTPDSAYRKALWDNEQVALVYTKADGSPAGGSFPDNPNGSTDDIAGVCDATGLVFGLMPHPERYVDPTQHPAWTSQPKLPRAGRGLRVFENAVAHVRDAIGAGV